MPKPTYKINRTIRSEQVLQAFMSVLRPHLPLDLQNTRITADDILYVLAYASVHRLSIDSACKELEQAPSANRFREVLALALPERQRLQRELNTVFRQQLPRCFLKGKRSYSMALDITLIPYHGQPHQDEKELVRGEAKSGTTHFHGYATVSIVHNKRRYVVALRFIQAGEETVEIVRWLLNRLKSLGIRIRRLYMDKGFCTIPVFRTLKRRKLSYVVPIPVRGRSGGVRRLFQGRASYQTTYTFGSPKYGAFTVQAAAVRRYCKDRYHRHGAKWFAYAIAGLPTGMSPRQVFELYRQRFGIETSYRQMNQVRARTATRNPAIRLLLVGLAFILFNLYVTLRDRLTTSPKSSSKPPAKEWLSLRRIALLLARAIEQRWGVAQVIQHQPSNAFS
jgi:putative transposase